jgi:cytochrome c
MTVAAALMVAGSAMATDMPAVGKAKCGACHAIDKKVVGPAWNDVAKKYKGDANAASKIAANITKGGEFGWKMGKMLPRGMGATDAEIKSLSEFIAGLK